jgi:putative GTP pyrophosphokinase
MTSNASDHYVVTLPEKFKGTRYDEIKSLKCEIQVRTILMDAWASVSHHLVYKQVIDVPTEALADFNALTGLFYVADTHFEMFRQASQSRSITLMKRAREGRLDLDQEINLETLKAYVTAKYPDREWRYPPHLMSELRIFGYKRLSQLDEKITAASPALREIEHEEGIEWSSEGLVRTVLDLVDAKYFRARVKGYGDQRPIPASYRRLVEKYRRKLRK